MKWISALLLFFSTTSFAEPNLTMLINNDAIVSKIKKLSSKIDAEYKGQELTIIMVMKGAICITADLIRNLETPFKLEYIQANSYGMHEPEKGSVKLEGLEKLNLENKNILIVDDIFDSGKTMRAIVRYVNGKNPKSVKSLVLFSKKPVNGFSYRPDYVLFKMDEILAKVPKGHTREKIIVGYGIDHHELHRGLPGIYIYSNQ